MFLLYGRAAGWSRGWWRECNGVEPYAHIALAQTEGRTPAELKIVQERSGYFPAAITMYGYGHGSEELQREATERFAAMLDA